MIEMTFDQIDAIVIDELKEAYELNLQIDRDEGGQALEPDWELLASIEKVLSYFMPVAEYERWHREAALKKLTTTSELMGGYEV
jgi:hypothetical protein